jgi:hypothetical protein
MRRPPPPELRVRWQISLSRFGSAPERRMEPAYAATLMHQVMSGTGGPAVHPKGRSA